MRKFLFISIAALILSLGLSSCLGDDNNEDYKEWRNANDLYMLKMENDTSYTRISPDWAPGVYVLMKWHNNRAETEKNLRPLYNSTCNTVFRLKLIDETVADSSYSQKTHGDSIYQTKPSSTVVGFSVALMNMHVGDSCTVIVPYSAGYGDLTQGKVKPYSTLIFDLKLKSIPAYEKD